MSSNSKVGTEPLMMVPPFTTAHTFCMSHNSYSLRDSDFVRTEWVPLNSKVYLHSCDPSHENHTNGYPFEPFKPFACRLSAVQERHKAVRTAVITRSKKICIRSNGSGYPFGKKSSPFERLPLAVQKKSSPVRTANVIRLEKNELPAHPFQNDYRNSSHLNGYRKSSSLFGRRFAVDLFLFSFAHHTICICQKKFETFSMPHTSRFIHVHWTKTPSEWSFYCRGDTWIWKKTILICPAKLQRKQRNGWAVHMCQTNGTIGCQKVCCVTNNCSYAMQISAYS